ncbi:hypothetical protein RN001_015427 [Aquatica leii]|uniref:Kinesin motor domain-containing protein n=1 Tax=Aquatica leii TaxID=1421715 RepID=A0AAN7P1T1_9COLE|nr:hypothetical protein RN001_015427 [Aquatica leii]
MSSTSKNTESDTQPIQVFVRIRPFIEDEHRVSGIETSASKGVLVKGSFNKRFNFDRVFGHENEQSSIYDAVCKGYISEVISGYNCSVITYGPAFTGKTYTMTGAMPNITYDSQCSLNARNIYENDGLVEGCGLIPRFISELFEEVHSSTQRYTVWCTYFELYNEELRDLLSRNPNHIRLYDDPLNKGSTIVRGVEEVFVNNKFEVFKLLKQAQLKKEAVTKSPNENPIYSHTIFTVYVRTEETDSNGVEVMKMGKLSFYDLSGTEYITKSDRQGRESSNTSRSLLTLRRVVKALSEKSSHVPFRESKLTRILQNSLGGKTKTSIIANIAPGIQGIDETVATLQFAQSARTVNNKPEVNKKFPQKKLVAQYIDEIARLRKDLDSTRNQNGVWLHPENHEKLLDEIAQYKTTINAIEMKLNDYKEQIQMMNLNVQSACQDVNGYTSNLSTKVTEGQENASLLKTQEIELLNQIQDIITNCKQNINVETDWIEEPFAQHEKNVEHLRQTYNTHCEGFKRNLSSLENWIPNLSLSSTDEEDSDDMCDEAKNFMSAFEDRCSKMESTLKDRSTCDNVVKILEDCGRRSNVLLDTMANAKLNIRQRILSGIEQVQADLTEKKKQQLNLISNCQERVNQFKADTTGLIERAERDHEHSVNTLKIATNQIGEILSTDDSWNNHLNKHNTEATEKTKILQKQLGNISESVNIGTEKLLTKTHDAHQEQKRIVSEALEDAHKSIMDTDQQDVVFSEVTKKFQEQSKYDGLVLLDNFSQLETMIKCTDTNITEVNHAGDTPTRTQYKYPPGFKDITPKDKVLSRFRERLVENRDDVESFTTPEPDTSNENS